METLSYFARTIDFAAGSESGSPVDPGERIQIMGSRDPRAGCKDDNLRGVVTWEFKREMLRAVKYDRRSLKARHLAA